MNSPDLSPSEYRELVEQAPVLIWRADADGVRDYFNERWLAFTGRTLEQELGDGWAEGVHPDDLADCLATYRGALSRREPFEMRYRLRRGNGDYRWLHDRGAPLAGGGEERPGYVGSCIDVTELVEAREACRRSEERFDLFMRHVPAAAFLKDDEGRFVYVNRGFEEEFRTTADDVLGKTPEDLYPPGLATRFSDEDRAVRSGARVVTVRERRVLDGAERVWDVRKFAVPDGGRDGPAFVGGLAVDVTAVAAAEKNLRRSEARLEALLRLGELGDRPLQEVMDFGLEEAVRLTQSRVGYVYFYDEATEKFTLHSWSNAVMAECAVVEKQTVYDLHMTGLWGEAVRQRRPIVVNDFSAEHPWKKGYPEGHVRLTRYLTVPVFQAGRIVAVAGVGNKEDPYGEDDVRQLQLYMDRLWGIVERQRAEAALQASEARFRRLVATLPHGVEEIDVAGRLVFCNEAMGRIMGCEPGRLVGRSVFDLVAPGTDLPALRAYWNHLVADQPPPTPYLGQNRTDDGRLIDVLVDWDYARSEAGELRGFVAVVTDVTTRVEAERRLRESEDRLRFLLTQVPAVLWAVDRDLRFTVFAGAQMAQIGVDTKQWVGRTLGDYFRGADEAALVLEKHRRALAGEELAYAVEHRGILFDVHLKPQRDHEKRIVGALGLALDVTERERVQAALRRSEERYRAVVEDQTEVISRFRSDGTLTFVNGVYSRIFLKTPEEVLGQQWQPAVVPEDLPMIEAKLAEMGPSTPVVTIENRVVTPTRGVRWMQFVNRGFYDAGGRLLEIQAVGRDVTERREAQERERAYERQLQRLASELSLAEERERRTLAAELHDTVAQGLAVARMRLGAVRATCPVPPCCAGMDEVLGLVGQALRDTRALLLDLSSPVLYHLGLAAALETLGEETCRKAGLSWDFAADGRPKELGLDVQVLLYQSVRELLTNVVKHAKARSVDVRVWEEGGRVCVQVADDGVGVPPSAGEEVPREERGFGLFSIRERLRLVGGQLRIEGAPGGGSRVLLSVPVSAAEET